MMRKSAEERRRRMRETLAPKNKRETRRGGKKGIGRLSLLQFVCLVREVVEISTGP
jgi:hypothetical protein